MGKPPESQIWVFQSIFVALSIALCVHTLKNAHKSTCLHVVMWVGGFVHKYTCGFVDKVSQVERAEKPEI